MLKPQKTTHCMLREMEVWLPDDEAYLKLELLRLLEEDQSEL